MAFRALLGSLALHALVLLGVFAMGGQDPAPGVSAPSIIEVALVRLAGPSDGPGRVPDTRAVAEEPTPRAPDPGGPAPGADRAAQTAAMAPFDPAAERMLVPPPLEPILASEPAAVTPTGLPLETPAPRPTIVMLETAAIRPTLELEPMPAPATADIPQDERRMLDRKLWKWSTELEALTGEEVSWTHRGQEFTATLRRADVANSMGIDRVVVAVSTMRDGSRWATEMHLKRLAFSSFAQFVDRWDPGVQIHDDEIYGRFHSNSEISISSSRGIQPSFYGKVTTTDGVNSSRWARPVPHSEIFLGGLETRVRKIALPGAFTPPASATGEIEGEWRRFDDDTRIVFYVDGSYGWRTIGSAAAESRAPLPAGPLYLIGADDVSLSLRGVVDGTVLVYAPANIVIEGDLVYASDPRRAPASDDYIGLIAGRNVYVAEPAVTGPGDLNVHAAILAMRRFAIRRYRAAGTSTLHVLGSLSAGSLSATEPRFRTRLTFDTRLEETRPPGFPMTDRYELVAWDGLWTEVPP